MSSALDYQFGHIHVYCSDLAATERWFLDGIGAELVTRRDSRGTPTTVLRLAGAEILLRPVRAGEELVPAGPRSFGMDHFALAVTDIDAAAAELKRRGVTVEVEPMDFTPSLRIAFVRGPDDVRIELLQYR